MSTDIRRNDNRRFAAKSYRYSLMWLIVACILAFVCETSARYGYEFIEGLSCALMIITMLVAIGYGYDGDKLSAES